MIANENNSPDSVNLLRQALMEKTGEKSMPKPAQPIVSFPVASVYASTDDSTVCNGHSHNHENKRKAKDDDDIAYYCNTSDDIDYKPDPRERQTDELERNEL